MAKLPAETCRIRNWRQREKGLGSVLQHISICDTQFERDSAARDLYVGMSAVTCILLIISLYHIFEAVASGVTPSKNPPLTTALMSWLAIAVGGGSLRLPST